MKRVALVLIVIAIIGWWRISGEDRRCRRNLGQMYQKAYEYAQEHGGYLPNTLHELKIPKQNLFCSACDRVLKNVGLKGYVSSYFFIPRGKKLSAVGQSVLFRDSVQHHGGFRYVTGDGEINFYLGEEFP